MKIEERKVKKFHILNNLCVFTLHLSIKCDLQKYIQVWNKNCFLHPTIKEKEKQLNVRSLLTSPVLISYFVGRGLLLEIKASINRALIISTSNHMFGRVTWGKLPEWIFENFEKIFQISRGLFIPKIARTRDVITG